MGERKTYHRGRRKKKKGGIISTLILIIAIAVFCVSGYQLYKILVDIIRVNPNTTRFGKWRYMAMTRMKMNSW